MRPWPPGRAAGWLGAASPAALRAALGGGQPRNRHPLRGAEKTKRRTHNKWCDLHTLLGLEAFGGHRTIASRLEAIPIRLDAIASRLEAIASRLEAIASRLEGIRE